MANRRAGWAAPSATVVRAKKTDQRRNGVGLGVRFQRGDYLAG